MKIGNIVKVMVEYIYTGAASLIFFFSGVSSPGGAGEVFLKQSNIPLSIKSSLSSIKNIFSSHTPSNLTYSNIKNNAKIIKTNLIK